MHLSSSFTWARALAECSLSYFYLHFTSLSTLMPYSSSFHLYCLKTSSNPLPRFKWLILAYLHLYHLLPTTSSTKTLTYRKLDFLVLSLIHTHHITTMQMRGGEIETKSNSIDLFNRLCMDVTSMAITYPMAV